MIDNEEQSKYYKSKRGKKKFTIECRYIGETSFLNKDWKIYKRYHTEKDRDRALEALNRKVKIGLNQTYLNGLFKIYTHWEYRKGKDVI